MVNLVVERVSSSSLTLASRSKSETKTESFFESRFDKRSSPEVTSATEDVFNRASSSHAQESSIT